jgi:DNA-directed RNA polymerase alpha subunit
VIEVIDNFQGGLKDCLIMEVKSKYKDLSPKEFMSFAGEVVASYAKLFVFDDIYVDSAMFVELEDLHEEKEKLPEEMNIKTMPIDALPLSERTRNALIKNSILYVEDLEKKRKVELLSMK